MKDRTVLWRLTRSEIKAIGEFVKVPKNLDGTEVKLKLCSLPFVKVFFVFLIDRCCRHQYCRPLMEDKEEFVFIHFEQPHSAFYAFCGEFEVAARRLRQKICGTTSADNNSSAITKSERIRGSEE